jgi:hypothetical protein
MIFWNSTRDNWFDCITQVTLSGSQQKKLTRSYFFLESLFILSSAIFALDVVYTHQPDGAG